jgi:hypothetical protein
MLFEQYYSQDLLTPSINDGGVNKLNSSLPSLDFYLLEDIDAYLPPIQSKTNTNDLINDSNNDNSQYQDDLFSDFDFSELNDLEEKSGRNKNGFVLIIKLLFLFFNRFSYKFYTD